MSTRIAFLVALVAAVAVGGIGPVAAEPRPTVDRPTATNGETAAPGRAEVPQSGVIPRAAPELLPGLDARLVGAALAPGPSAVAAAKMAMAEDEAAAFASRAAALDTQIQALAPLRTEASAARDGARTRAQVERVRMERLVAAVYVRGGSEVDVSNPVNDATDLGRGDLLAARVQREIVTAFRIATQAQAAAQRELDRIDTETARLTADRDAAQRGEADAQARVQAAADDVRRLLPAATVSDLNIPLFSLDAYLRAERVLAFEAPTCAIPWYAIAGIAVNESNHGRFRGATPDATGRVEPPIIGVPLNGSGVAAIGDSDGGFYDGDVEWDRAVGPLQFIPGTWNRWKADGNFDGFTDPQNMYDAALGAARYLCQGARPFGFADRGAANHAFLAYNNAQWYADKVFTRAEQYAHWGLPGTGPLPPLWSAPADAAPVSSP